MLRSRSRQVSAMWKNSSIMLDILLESADVQVISRDGPGGGVCQAVRAPGSNVTLAPAARAGAWAPNSGSMRTMPVNQSAGPLADGCEPTLVTSISFPLVMFERVSA